MIKILNKVHAVVNFSVNKDFEDDFLILAEAMLYKVRQESANIYYTLIKKREEECEYAFIGIWTDDQGLEDHFDSDHFRNFTPKIGEFLNRIKVDICDTLL